MRFSASRLQTPFTDVERERIASKIAFPDDVDGCWIWIAYLRPDGYGEVWFRGGSAVVPRLMYLHFNGPLPDGYEPDHLCRDRACVNPRHLEGVTKRVNILRGDGLAAREARSDACANGHLWTPENTRVTPRQRVCRTCVREWSRRRRALVPV